jgi:hypothetical protein
LAGFFKNYRRNIHIEQRETVLPPRPGNLLMGKDDDVTDWTCCVMSWELWSQDIRLAS